MSADGKTHYVVKENDVDVYTFPEKVHFREFEKPEYQKMVAADMSPGVQWLFIAFADLSLHGWELDKPKKLTDTMFGVPQVAATTILQKLPAAPGFLATAPGGKRVALAMADGAWLMDPKSRKPIAVLSPSGGYVCCFAFSFAGDLLAVADSSGKISLYETAKGKPVRTLAAQSGAVSAIAFSRDGRLFAAAGADRMIKIFEVATGNELTSITDKD